ncbi:hypothetical protein R1flu_015614 [Riccia fluitans]|uniref:Hexosyltransferase n=1 Tax=Riccia fluitans TaxID=41844 RepID=A0ABD1YJN3_9MARC
MPDYDRGGNGSMMLMRRNSSRRGEELDRRRRGFYGPGGLPTEGLDPAPKTRLWASWLALFLCICFLALQLWPTQHHHRPATDRILQDEVEGNSNEHPDENLERDMSLELIRRQWDPEFVDATEDLDSHSKINYFSPPLLEVEKVGGGSSTFEVEKGDVETTLNLGAKKQEQEGHNLELREEKENKIHVFVSSDEKDLRPLAVVINSTLQNARHSDRIVFHLVIPLSESKIEYYKLKAFFPSANIEIFRGSINFEKLSKLIQFRNDSHARVELTSPYNFVPFYLPQLYKDIELMIYLDSDVVVKGDIEELYTKDLHGHPIAAVEDCSQRFRSYFDFEQLRAIHEGKGPDLVNAPQEYIDEETCVFNRGVLLMNATRWTELNITDAIEWWMEQFQKAEEPLYRYGLSQPPFLLALYNKYEKLEHAWNERGLGRARFSKLELDYFSTQYKDKQLHQKPFWSFESDSAKILHFNGQYKPWKRDPVRLPWESETGDVVSLCGQRGQECAYLWSGHGLDALAVWYSSVLGELKDSEVQNSRLENLEPR